MAARQRDVIAQLRISIAQLLNHRLQMFDSFWSRTLLASRGW